MNRRRTTWKEFFKTGKWWIIKDKLNEKIKPKIKPKPKEIYWELKIYMVGNHTTSFLTIQPDSDKFEGQHVFDRFIEWFQCSDSPSYAMWFDTNSLKIFVRDKIIEIEVVKKEI